MLLRRTSHVLEDLRQAVAELTALDTDAADNLSLFRRRYLTVVVLARAVGHILDKVESTASPAHALAIREAWASIKREDLFIHFIDQDRNSFLKEYEAVAALNDHTWAEPVEDTAILDTRFHVYRSVTFPILRGTYQGQDLRDIAREVIAFWDRWVPQIEARIVELLPGTEPSDLSNAAPAE